IVFFEAPHRIRQTLCDLQAMVGECDVVLARELTKTHEELVRGPISVVLSGSWIARGEFTVVVDIGHVTEMSPRLAVSGDELGERLGLLTSSGSLSRRKAIAELARRYGRSPNEVYKAIEEAKRDSVE